MVEHSLLLTLLLVAMVTALTVLGTQSKERICDVAYAIDGGTSGTGLPGPGSLEYDCFRPADVAADDT